MNRKKIMTFEGGPQDGKSLQWKNDEQGPPPNSICPIDENTVGLYERDEIDPGKKTIEYIYTYKGERQEVQQ